MGNTVQIASNRYKAIAASTSNAPLGLTGGQPTDVLEGILVVPATTSPGAVSITDGATTTTVFAGGAGSLSNLVPFFIPLGGIRSVTTGWKVTTGANLSVIAVGRIS